MVDELTEARRRLHDMFSAKGVSVLAFEVHALVEALDLRRLEWLQIISARYQEHHAERDLPIPEILAVTADHPRAAEVRTILGG